MSKFEPIFGDHNAKIALVLTSLKRKHSYSYQRRMQKTFADYTEFCVDLYKNVHKGNLAQSFVHFRDFTFRQQGKEVPSINDDMRALRRLLKILMSIKALPRVQLPPNLIINKEILQNIKENPLLGSLNPKKWESDLKGKSHPLLNSISDEEYLSILIEHIRSNRNLLLEIAKEYVSQAHERFTDGEAYIESADISLFNSDNLLDQSQPQNKGQRPSLFSSNLPNNQGLKNLVAYLKLKHNGLMSRDFAGSNNHLYRYGGRTELSEHMGISSDSAAACAVVIVTETGINPESLYEMKIKDSRNNVTFYLPSDSEGSGFSITYNKPRAKKKISKPIKVNSQKINAEFCFKYLLKATEHHRSIIEPTLSNFLFIHDSTFKQNHINPISATGFKSGFHRIINKALSEADDSQEESRIDQLAMIISNRPNLAKIRKTEGVLKWFDTGGDPRAAALYLGNTTRVAIKNYIPLQLQTMLYTKQIRAFQNVLISVASDGTSYQQQALGLKSPEELSEYLEQLSKQDLNWSTLGKINCEERKKADNIISVVLTESGIAFLYAAYISQSELLANGQNPPEKLKKWATVATSLFNKIRASGTRGQKVMMKKGIALYNGSPTEFSV